jgi:hypothetical protein
MNNARGVEVELSWLYFSINAIFITPVQYLKNSRLPRGVSTRQLK